MSDIETFDREISRLQAEAAAVERAPQTFDERWPAVEAELLAAEEVFRSVGPELGVAVSMLPEHVYRRRQAMVGMAMVANRKALLDSERARIKAQTEGGISAVDKQRRQGQLLSALLRAAARRELALREIENDGEFQPRLVHPELAIYKRTAVETLAR